MPPTAFFRRLAAAQGLHTLLAGCAVTVAMLCLYVVQPALLARLDLKIYDMLLPLRAQPAPSPVPVIIDLDEASLAAYGQWPWPRYRVAALLDSLTEYGVAAVGLDIMFAEEDRSSPNRMREELRRDTAFTPEVSGIPPEFYNYDLLLANSLRKTPAVLGAYARFTGLAPEANMNAPSSISIIERIRPGGAEPLPLLSTAHSAVLPLPLLRDAAPIGFTNANADADGIVREIPLLVRIGDEVHASLALRALMRAMQMDRVTLFSGLNGLETVKVGAYSVAVSPLGAMRIPFIGPRKTYPYFSAADVLGKKIAPHALQGKVAFVGTSSPGLADIRAMPFDSAYPGVETHAASLDAILSGNAIIIPTWTPALQMLGILCTGLICTLVFGFARPRVYLPLACALAALAVLLARHFFAAGLFVSPMYFMLTIASAGTLLLLARFRQEEKQKLALRGIFSRYVSPQVVKRIIQSREDFFAGEERELSIMFTDIRGFTPLSEKLNPKEIVTLLNTYFTPMTALVRENDGTLDKFIGDALMAYWNAPLDVPEHPRLAVATALGMQERLMVLNEQLLASLALEIRIGIGIHTGTAFVGNMGSKDLVNYTLIGDNVNLASRLEGLCPHYGVGIVASGSTREGCADAFAFQHLDTLRVKGKKRPVTIHSPMRHEEAQARQAELDAWEEARALYTAGRFAQAAQHLDALCAEFPQARLYAMFAGRARQLLAQPPADWDGVWTLSAK